MAIPKDSKLIEQWKKHKSASESGLSSQHSDARENHRFYSGDSAAYTASVQDKSSKRMVVFNKVKPYVNSVAGFMIQMRRKPEYQARIFDNEQQQLASSYMNSLSDYARDNGNLDSIESMQDREMLICGFGAVDSAIIYEDNPDGDVKGEVVKYNDIFWDPQARETNLIDSRWVFRRKAYDVKEALKRFKGSKEEDFESYDEDKNSDLEYNPNGGEYDKISIGSGAEENLIQVFYYQWWSLETYYRADNPLFELEDQEQATLIAQVMQTMQTNRAKISTKEQVNEIFEFDPLAEHLVMTPTIKKDLEVLFERFDVEFDPVEYNKKVYYTAIVSGKNVLNKFKSADQRGFTIKFKTADFDTERKRWNGMVSSLKEPARYANKALTEILYVIASNSKGGVMYEESAVDDPQRFEQQYATTKAAIKVNDGALSNGRIQPKATASLPNGYENVYNISNQSIQEVSGINREFLGTSENRQVSALMELQRINQVMSNLAIYFDAIALYQKEHAGLMITFLKMLAENSENRLVSVIGEDGARNYEVLSSDKFVDEYDISIGEAPTSATQKEQTATTMIGMAERLQALGINIWDTVVPYLPIKISDQQKLIERLVPSEEAQAAEAQQNAKQAQEQDALNAAILEGQQAKAAKDIADAQKAVAAIPNIEAETDETRANTVKILEEGRQTAVENDVLQELGASQVTVNI